MAEQTIRIASAHGLHARPASIFTQAAAAAGVPVQLSKGGKSVNAASILGVISLGIDHGDEVTVSAEGEDAERIVGDLVALLANDLDEN
ncbi:HPr family phosphocarrier protein [Parafrigoribacterium soli]|uniref:HPr family phosphocarrier protein n=1 Tax=Parafrigoribacterium soli TaxID=3144663 RepID=UPI0032EFF923